ncbi:MAG: hypothetical protein Q7U99_08710 [Rubrivivax sp.]|nr:hypothetical protein [Rubrivivax sp.]
MPRRSRLTPEQWAQARRRWEGDPRPGFQWLLSEVELAWGANITRPGLGITAKRQGWAKGGKPVEPLARVPSAHRSHAAIRVVGTGAKGSTADFAQRLLAFFAVPLVAEDGSKVLPTLQRFAQTAGLTAAALQALAHEQEVRGPAHPELAAALAKAQDLQVALLIEGAAVGDFDPNLAALALGWLSP